MKPSLNELLKLVFNTNIGFDPSIGLVLLLYYIAEFYTSMVLVLYCMQKASIAHHCCIVLMVILLLELQLHKSDYQQAV